MALRRAARSIAEDVWREAQRAWRRAAEMGKGSPNSFGPSLHDPVSVIEAAIEAVRAEPCSCQCPDCSAHPHGTTAKRPTT